MRGFFLLFMFGAALNSCIPLPTEQGVCRTANGDVNTHNIVGIWKKVPQTASEKAEFSSDTFRLLYVAQGNANGVVLEGDVIDGIEIDYSHAICIVRVNGEQQIKPIESGLYYLDSPNNRIRLNMVTGLDNRSGSQGEYEGWVGYRFSGNCNGTRMTLTRGSSVEEYTFFGTAPSNSLCNFGVTPSN